MWVFTVLSPEYRSRACFVAQTGGGLSEQVALAKVVILMRLRLLCKNNLRRESNKAALK